jgi:hypothetical protein
LFNLTKEIVMRFRKTIVALAIGSAAATAWAAAGPEFGMFGGEGRGGHHASTEPIMGPVTAVPGA